MQDQMKYSVKNYKRKSQRFCANFSVIKDYESQEENQIKLELVKEKVKAQLKLQDIYKKRQLETIKYTDAEYTNYVV